MQLLCQKAAPRHFSFLVAIGRCKETTTGSPQPHGVGPHSCPLCTGDSCPGTDLPLSQLSRLWDPPSAPSLKPNYLPRSINSSFIMSSRRAFPLSSLLPAHAGMIRLRISTHEMELPIEQEDKCRVAVLWVTSFFLFCLLLRNSQEALLAADHIWFLDVPRMSRAGCKHCTP